MVVSEYLPGNTEIFPDNRKFFRLDLKISATGFTTPLETEPDWRRCRHLHRWHFIFLRFLEQVSILHHFFITVDWLTQINYRVHIRHSLVYICFRCFTCIFITLIVANTFRSLHFGFIIFFSISRFRFFSLLLCTRDRIRLHVFFMFNGHLWSGFQFNF